MQKVIVAKFFLNLAASGCCQIKPSSCAIVKSAIVRVCNLGAQRCTIVSRFQTINFHKWIEEHRHLLKPPVGNKVIWEDSEFIIMIVGGPNSRTDYHDDPGEEFFYQLEGDMILKIVDYDNSATDFKIIDLKIAQGEIFLLPAHVPHSPRRPADSVGLVVERKRHAGEFDGFIWFCENCSCKLYEEFLPVDDIVAQLPQVFNRFYNNDDNCLCKKCGKRMAKPDVKTYAQN